MSLIKKLVVIAPHPDDEVLGVGGTLVKKKLQGFKTYCIFLTSLKKTNSSTKQKKNQIKELNNACNKLMIDKTYNLNFEPTKLDQVNKVKIITKISKIFNEIKPEEVYLPFLDDIHSDHLIANQVGLSCCKWFRNQFIKKVFSYETLSETHLIKSSKLKNFNPTYFVDISKFIKIKTDAFKCYQSQIQKHPYPRNLKALNSLSIFRGTSAGFRNAEAFETLFLKD
jgi:N-acetylglucosamine malate deacetylase 1